MMDNGRGDGESHPAVSRTSFDPDVEPASDAVLAALDAVIEDPVDQQSIDDVVDPIVFDALVRRARSRLAVTFDYAGHEVRIDSTGEIIVRPMDENGTPDQVYSFEDESPTEAVARAVADAEGVDPVELEPIYGAIDPEALNSILDQAEGPNGMTCRVSFRLEDTHVSVSSDRRVFVRSASSETDGVEGRS